MSNGHGFLLVTICLPLHSEMLASCLLYVQNGIAYASILYDARLPFRSNSSSHDDETDVECATENGDEFGGTQIRARRVWAAPSVVDAGSRRRAYLSLGFSRY